MLGSLLFCILTGVVCAATSLVLFDATIWIAVLWYGVGCCAGLAVIMEIFILAKTSRKRATASLRPE